MQNKILKDPGAKFGAFFIAFLLWFLVVINRSYEDVFHVPLEVEDVPAGFVISSSVPRDVVARFYGQGKQLLQLRYFSKPRAVLKVTSKGRYEYNLSPKDVRIPSDLNVQVLEIVEPQAIKITLDRLKMKKVKVVPRISLQLVDGYTQVGPVSLEPESVRVVGPQRFIKGLKSVLLDSLTLTKVKQDVFKTVRVILPEGENVSCLPEVVTLSIDVQELGERWIADIPVELRYLPKGVKARVEPSTIALKVVGGVDLLASLRSADFSVYIDYRRVGRVRNDQVAAMISTPPEIRWIEARPERFTVIRQ